MRIHLRCYEELNDYLPAECRKVTFEHALAAGSTVADAVAELGIPLPEIDLALVNGESVGFDHALADGDRLSLYPVFEAFDIGAVQRLREAPLRRLVFVVDAGLEQVGEALRAQGYEVLFAKREPPEAWRQALDEGATMISDDAERLAERSPQRGYRVRAERAREQIREVLARFDLGRTDPIH